MRLLVCRLLTPCRPGILNTLPANVMLRSAIIQAESAFVHSELTDGLPTHRDVRLFTAFATASEISDSPNHCPVPGLPSLAESLRRRADSCILQAQQPC